mgnify:CR=1 FL=1
MIKTGQKNTKPFYKIKIRLNRASELIKEKWVILLCVLSLFSSFADMPVSAVALVFLQTAKYRITKCICAAASVLYFVSTVTATAFYIPYIAFVFIENKPVSDGVESFPVVTSAVYSNSLSS